MLSKSLKLNFILLSFLFFSCNPNNTSNSSENSSFKLTAEQFEIKKDNYSGGIYLEGSLTFTNQSGFDFTDLNTHQGAILSIKYQDGKERKDIYCLAPEQRTWKNNTSLVFKFEYDVMMTRCNTMSFFQEDFKRTPAEATLSLTVLATDLDKEMPLQYETDILTAWKEYQKQIGLRN